MAPQPRICTRRQTPRSIRPTALVKLIVRDGSQTMLRYRHAVDVRDKMSPPTKRYKRAATTTPEMKVRV